MQNLSPPLNNQDAFNRVWTHFVLQQHPLCANQNGQCLYFHNNNGCAVGCMLPVELSIKADSAQVGDISSLIGNEEFPGINNWLHNVDVSLLKAMQHAHDATTGGGNLSGSLNELQDRLAVVAYKFNLNVPDSYHYYVAPTATATAI